MANPLARSIRAAEKASADLARLTARLGTAKHPRGKILVAFRQTRRALRRALAEDDRAGRPDREGVRHALQVWRLLVEGHVRRALLDGISIGRALAEAQLGAFGIAPPTGPVDRELYEAALGAVLAEVDRQRSQVATLLAAGAELALIVGSRARQGAVRPAPVIRETANWAARLSGAVYNQMVADASVDSVFQKQAIAALDERTTDCCARVHGQIQALNDPFQLTGTPRYADAMQTPPFHDYCRTVIVLYHEAYDDGLTERMRAGARTLLAEQAAGQVPEHHPATAFLE